MEPRSSRRRDELFLRFAHVVAEETVLKRTGTCLLLAALGLFAQPRVHTDMFGGVHARFRQMHQAVRVLGAEVIIHLNRDDQPRNPTQKVYTNIDISVLPAVQKTAAEQTIAREYSRADPSQASIVDTELVIWPQLESILEAAPEKRPVRTIPNAAEYKAAPRAYRLQAVHI